MFADTKNDKCGFGPNDQLAELAWATDVKNAHSGTMDVKKVVK